MVSVIVPVYNCELYLEKCVRSLIDQTYADIEIILVDDGSKDNSPMLCDQFADEDSRIKVVHKENGGLSDARNKGMALSCGDYFCFVDSDDWVDDQYVECLLYLIEKYHTDISICGFEYHTIHGDIISNSKNDSREICFSEKEALQSLLTGEYFYTSACAKLYRKSIFENRTFPVGRLYEDINVTYDIFTEGHTASYIAKGLYHYIKRDNSITTASFSPQKMDSVIFTSEAIQKVIKKYPDLEEEANIRLFLSSYSFVYLGYDTDAVYQQCAAQCLKVIKGKRKYVLLSKMSSKKDKIKALLTFLPCDLVRKIHKSRE